MRATPRGRVATVASKNGREFRLGKAPRRTVAARRHPWYDRAAFGAAGAHVSGGHVSGGAMSRGRSRYRIWLPARLRIVTRLLLIPVWGAMAGSLLSPAQAFTEETVSLGQLHGTLALPAPEGPPVPAVLILAGSGPVDRDGNLPGMTNNSLRLVAHGLAGQGIASLRVDKRGIGESAPAALREEDLRFQTYVDDALAWAESLRQDPRIGRVYLLGHSEGALVATLAAQKGGVSGLILLAGAGQPAAQAIGRQLADAGVSEALQAASSRITGELLQGRHVADVPPDLMALYRPSVQDYLISWLPLDPAAELTRTAMPVLIIQGTTDLQVKEADARLLLAARPQAKLILIEGMNHVLKRAPSNRFLNLQTYAIPILPLADGLLPAITSFIGDR